MRKSTFIKRFVALFLVVLMSINTFAAVVGDNDGAAFITKAEFDSMKNDFQRQLDRYNSSIDNKIDGAIASYLAGIVVSKTETISLDANTNFRFPLLLFYNDNSWNQVDSDYYSISRPRIRVPKYSLISMPNPGQGSGNNTVVNDKNFRVTGTPVTPASAWNVTVNALMEEVWDIDPINGEVNLVTATTEQRHLGGYNYKIFNLNGQGLGYQYIDYKVRTSVSVGSNTGEFTVTNTAAGPDRGFVYTACLGLGSSTADVSSLKTSPQAYQCNWTSDAAWSVYGPAIDTDRSPTDGVNVYNWYVDANKNIKRRWNTLAGDWNGTPTWLVKASITPGTIDSANFNWQENGRKYLFAGNSYLPAQELKRFGFEPNWDDGANTEVTFITYTQPDHHQATFENRSSETLYVHRWTIKKPLWCPPMSATFYSGLASETVNAFCGLPAACVRWYDEENKEHYLDEGMFLKTFTNLSGEAVVSFEITFGSGSSTTENVNFYVSKKPFNRVNAKNELKSFRVDNDATIVTTKTFETGRKYKITVDGILNNDQLYILWEPVGGYDHYVTLNDFENFTITK